MTLSRKIILGFLLANLILILLPGFIFFFVRPVILEDLDITATRNSLTQEALGQAKVLSDATDESSRKFSRHMSDTVTNIFLFMIIGAATAVTLSLLFVIFFTRKIVGPVKGITQNLSSSAGKVDETSTSLTRSSSSLAVGADEIRNLAIRSAGAAKTTGDLIASTITNIDSGSLMVNSTAEALVSEAAEVSKEQTIGINQISKAMSEMDKVTQANATAAEESASSASRLSLQAGNLFHAVNQLDALAHGLESSGGQIKSKLSLSALPKPGDKPH